MKKMLLLGVLSVALCGCGSQETFETITDAYQEPVMAQSWQLAVDLPAEAVMPIMETDREDKLYVCDSYTLSTHITQSGDLNETIRTYTGLSMEQLELIGTNADAWKRYEGIWTSAAEDGEQIGRIAVLDDGEHHYVLLAMTQSDSAGELTEVWQPIFRSFRLVEADSQVSSGS